MLIPDEIEKSENPTVELICVCAGLDTDYP